MRTLFRNFSQKVAEVVGSPWAFLAGVMVTLIWAATGPLFKYSDTWQLVINTGTTIITFLMVICDSEHAEQRL
jgi:low affinity Fe/Cu permease